MSLSSLSSLSDPEEIDIPRRRMIPDRVDLFSKHDGEEFWLRYRMSKEAVLQVLKLLDLEPMTQRNKSIDGLTQLLVCLRFLATGSLQKVLADLTNIHKSTVCRIVQKVTRELAKLSQTYIKMPEGEELRRVAEGFYRIAGFPRVAGVVDCTHIKIICRGAMSELYRCTNGYFSINVQVVCDASFKIRNIIARWPGSVHNCAIFNKSPLCEDFEMGRYQNYHLLGGGSYYNRNFLLTPLSEPQTPAEEDYNKSHTATRKTVEQCFGIWKRRCPCLVKGITLNKTSTILQVIVAAAVLHNICIELDEGPPPDDMFIDTKDPSIPPPYSTDINTNENETSVRTTLINNLFSKLTRSKTTTR